MMRPAFRPAALAAALLLALAAGCSAPPPAPPPAPPLARLSPLPPELAAALQGFRVEGPKGWAFTQTTAGEGRVRVERHDPRHRGAERWTLLSENGRPPTDEEQQRYRAARPLHDSAANLVGQLRRDHADLVADEPAGPTYEFALTPAGEHDIAAEHMRARFTLDRATGAISRVELYNLRPFKPARSLTIHEARTTVRYTPATADRPALPVEVVMHIRGERYWFRDFSQDMTSTFTAQEPVIFHPRAEAVENGVDKGPPPPVSRPPSTEEATAR